MKMDLDVFRPIHDPSRTIYDAFQREATKRINRSVAEWIAAERECVWIAARDFAQQNGCRVPLLSEIQAVETSAQGHVDYGAKWAYGVAELFSK